MAPDPSTIIYCIACRKPTNGKGWYGPGCVCDVDLMKARPTHSIKAFKTPV